MRERDIALLDVVPNQEDIAVQGKSEIVFWKPRLGDEDLEDKGTVGGPGLAVSRK